MSNVKCAWINDDGRKLQIKQERGGYIIMYDTTRDRPKSLDGVVHDTYQDAYNEAMKFIKGER